MRVLLLLSTLILAGCATSALKLAPERPDRPWSSAPDYVLPPDPRQVASSPPLATVDSRHAYTLPELIDLAQSTNPATRVAWDQARNAALAAGIAESSFLPNLSAVAIGGYLSGEEHGAFSGSQTASGSISALVLKWLLFDFGQRSALVDAAHQHSAIVNIAFTAEHQAVIYKVSLAYYTNAAARTRARNAAASLQDASKIQVAAEERYRRGIGTVVEVAQARQATAQASLAQVQADGAANDTYISLIAATGISPLAKIRIADLPAQTLTADVVPDIDRLVADALARRTDMASAYAAHEESLARLEAARAEFLPKLFLATTGSYATGSLRFPALSLGGEQLPSTNLSTTQSAVNVLLGVTIPIYDGGVRDAQLEQARTDSDRTTALLAQTGDEATRQVVAAQNAVKTSLSACIASRALEKAAQTTFDAAFASYRHGVGSITDATAAEMQLLHARDATSDATSTALIAAATLALSTGVLGIAPQ
jgi:outer membrane protein TolC